MQSIRNFFHTDTWWGKTIFIVLIYSLYWCVFYGSWLIVPREYFDKNTGLSGILFLILNVIIVPAISFFIPHFIKKLFQINKFFLYILHIFLILFALGLFLYIGIFIALSNIQIG